MAFVRGTGSILLLSIWACTVEVQSIEAQEAPIPQLTPGSQRKECRADGSERLSAANSIG